MKCTANTKMPGYPKLGKQMAIRCERPIGHGGLHRFLYGGKVIEFTDSMSFFPHYDIPDHENTRMWEQDETLRHLD